jgi:hypothetical protein
MIHETNVAKMALGEVLPSYLPEDTLELPAAVVLHLAAGKADWLNGRCVARLFVRCLMLTAVCNRRFWNVNWDFAEVERDWKEKILAQNGLVNKLNIPK